MELTYPQYWEKAEALGIPLDEAARAIEIPADVFADHARVNKGKAKRMTASQNRLGQAFLERRSEAEQGTGTASSFVEPPVIPASVSEPNAVKEPAEMQSIPSIDDTRQGGADWRSGANVNGANDGEALMTAAPFSTTDGRREAKATHTAESPPETSLPAKAQKLTEECTRTVRIAVDPPAIDAVATSPAAETREAVPNGVGPAAGQEREREAKPATRAVDDIGHARAKTDLAERALAVRVVDHPATGISAEPIETVPPGEAHTFPPLDLVDASSLQARALNCLWPNRVFGGSLTLIAGYPDRGKSLLTALMAATVSSGLPWPDSEQVAPVGKVLMLGTEDDHETVVVPRLLAAGADLSRVKVLPPESTSFGAEEFVGRLDAALREHHDVRLVILDPLMALLRGLSSAGNDRVRSAMEGLQSVANRHGIAIVGIVHPNKRPSRQVIDALPGARALGAVVRTTWWVDIDPVDPERKIMIPATGRYGRTEGLGFRVEVVKIKDGLEAPRLVADGAPVRVTWNDLVAEPGKTTALGEARRFIATELADGPLSAEELAARATAAGISKATLRRAEQGAVERRKSGMNGPWMVHLVSTASKMPNAAEDAHERGGEHLREV